MQHIETVAQAIYEALKGMQERGTGEPGRVWKTDAPWDTNSEKELCEWERDEYRTMAEAAIRALEGATKA